MGEARDDPDEDGQPHLLGKPEGMGHHVIAFLLVRRFEDGNQREFAVEAGILLVLGGVHGRVVGGDDDDAAVHAGDAGVHEGIGADVHAHMLHADQRPFPGIGHAQGGLHGRFFIRTPAAADAAFLRERVSLDEFRDLGGRRARVGIDAGQTGVQGSQSKRFVTKQQSLSCHI